MDIAGELLALSMWLATMDPEQVQQAALRRSVSTAYYAVFHLLIISGSQRWNGTVADQANLERMFKHSSMKEVSKQFAAGTMRGSADLRDIAKFFVQLQDERHSADYDNQRHWSRDEVSNIVWKANEIFAKWETVREAPESGTYLLAMLIGRQR